MSTIAYQITSFTIVYSTVYSGTDQRKHQSSASLAFVWGIHRDRWIPRTNGQLRGKYFHLMTSPCNECLSYVTDSSASLRFSLEQMAGIFILLMAGVAISLVTVLLEYFVAAQRDVIMDRQERVCAKTVTIVGSVSIIYIDPTRKWIGVDPTVFAILLVISTELKITVGLVGEC